MARRPGTQDSLPTHNVGTQGEFPAEIASWLMCKYLNQVHSFQKLASCMQNPLILLDRQIWWWGCCPLFCPRCRSARWKFAKCLYMVFPRQSSIVACQNSGLEGCVALPRTPPKRMHSLRSFHVVPDITFACYDIARPDLGTVLMENYVHAYKTFRLCSFPMKYSDKVVCHVTLRKSRSPAFK